MRKLALGLLLGLFAADVAGHCLEGGCHDTLSAQTCHSCACPSHAAPPAAARVLKVPQRPERYQRRAERADKVLADKSFFHPPKSST